MEIKELKEKLEEQAFKLNKAKANGMMVAQETERMRNLLVNSYDEIINGLERADRLEREVSVLNMELADAERELDELTKKTTPKKKAEPKADE